jgi:hypothetical protein
MEGIVGVRRGIARGLVACMGTDSATEVPPLDAAGGAMGAVLGREVHTALGEWSGFAAWLRGACAGDERLLATLALATDAVPSRLDPARGGGGGAGPRCALCSLAIPAAPAHPTDGAVAWDDAAYHIGCANLWGNTVSVVPPHRRAPK